MQIEILDGVMRLSGDITVNTVTEAGLRQFRQAFKSGGQLGRMDFSAVGRADSACLSLLLTARRLNPSIKAQAVPASVWALAELYEIRDWMEA